MAVDDAILNKVTKYGKLIKKKEKIGHALSKLNKLEMTLDILSATNIGRCVNKLCHDPIYGPEASRIIEKWKEVARRGGIRGDDDDSSSESDDLQEYGRSPMRNDFSHETLHDQEHQSDIKKDLFEQKGNSHSGVQDSESYRHRGDDKDQRKHRSENQRKHRSESSKGTHEDNLVRSKDEYGRQEEGRVYADDSAMGCLPESPGSEWSEHADDQSGNHFVNRDDEYHSNCSEDSEKVEFKGNDKRKSHEKINERSHKRMRSPSRESNPASKPNLKSEATRSSISISKPVAKQIKKSESKKVVPDFETMLLSADSSPAKVPKPREALWKCSYGNVPMLNTYQPFSQTAHAPKEIAPSTDNFNPENMFKPRNERGKVFAGRRKVVSKDVMSLFTLCLRVLMNNTQVLLYAEYISYDVVKPILEKCTAEELSDIEAKHRYLEEDSEELWQRFVTKKYPGEEPDCDGTWKELYYIIEKEKEEKLKQLSLRIGKTHHIESMKGHRKAMLADATAPIDVRRRQMRHGTNVSKSLPSALEVSSARRKIFETGGSKDSLATLPKALVKSGISVNPRTENKKQPIKRGALMIKTMKMLKMKRK